jgi:hypothetical protein
MDAMSAADAEQVTSMSNFTKPSARDDYVVEGSQEGSSVGQLGPRRRLDIEVAVVDRAEDFPNRAVEASV